jgi:hypothetical protein
MEQEVNGAQYVYVYYEDNGNAAVQQVMVHDLRDESLQMVADMIPSPDDPREAKGKLELTDGCWVKCKETGSVYQVSKGHTGAWTVGCGSFSRFTDMAKYYDVICPALKVGDRLWQIEKRRWVTISEPAEFITAMTRLLNNHKNRGA